LNTIPERRTQVQRSLPLIVTCTALLSLLITPLHSIPLAGGAGRSRPVQNAVPVEIESLIAQATHAVNQHRLEALRTLSTEEAATAFAWTKRSTLEWEGDALPVPSGPFAEKEPTYLAVFHAWHLCQSEGDHVYRLAHTEQGWKLGDEIPETETLGFRVRDHNLRVTVNVAQKLANIRDQVRIERTAGGVPAFALLRLSQDFQVQSLKREDADAKPDISFKQVGGVLAFTPPADPAFTLGLRYEGSLNHRDGDFIHTDEAVLDSYWYPHIARLPATATFTATAPPGWTPLAQGELLHSDRAADGSQTVTYRNELPVSYFTLDMGRYTVTSRQVKGRTLTVYLMSPNSRLATQCLDVTEHALAYYEEHFGPFPYTRYGIVETKGPFNGALEAYSFSTYGPQNLPGTIEHELAHTWWGGIVPCTYTHSMWNEGFANYSEGLVERSTQQPWKPHLLSVQEAKDLLGARRIWARAYNASPLSEAYDTNESNQVAIGYEKGNEVLRVLEEEIGQEAMLRSMKRFIADHKRGEAADWSDFEAAVKQATGKDMRWFFAQWVERSGVPSPALESVQTRRAGGSTIIEGDIIQSDPPYRMKLPILLSLQNGDFMLTSVEVTGEKTHFQLKVASPPARLVLDPEAIIPFSVPASGDPTTYDFPQ